MIFKNITRLPHIIRYKYTYAKINELSEKDVGKSINIKGWTKGQRKMKENIFIDVNDGSCKDNLQLVIKKNLKAQPPGYGSSVDVTGNLCLSPQGKLELSADNINIIGKCPINEGFPFIPKQSYPPEYIRDYLHLRPRVSSSCSMFRVRHHASASFQKYLNKNGLIQIHTPIITTNVCEGGGEIFTIKPDNEQLLKHMAKHNVPKEQAFFDKKAFLTVSGQLHLEAMCHGLGNVYTFSPAFRAENSKTPTHLAEFYMLEIEQSFIQSIDEVTNFIEHMVKEVTTDLLSNCEKDINNAKATKLTETSWLNKSFPTFTYKEAITILENNSDQLKSPVNASEGLSKEQELFLVQHVNSPVFVVDWPTDMKPFYMRQKHDNPDIVEGFDLLVPFVGELAGGSIREDNYERLKTKLPNNLEWYLELRKFGGVTTGGFGLGFERYLQFLLGITNIKDVIPFPRWAHHCDM